MLRRPPTEIELKMDDIDEMIIKLEKRAHEQGIELEKSTTSSSPAHSSTRSRIGAPPPRIRMTQATDTLPIGTSNNSQGAN